MRRKNDSSKLLILIVVVIGLVFAISQWNKIYVHAEELETTSVSSGDAEIISAPSPIVVQTYSADYSDQLDEIQNQLTLLTTTLNPSGVYYDDTYLTPKNWCKIKCGETNCYYIIYFDNDAYYSYVYDGAVATGTDVDLRYISDTQNYSLRIGCTFPCGFTHGSSVLTNQDTGINLHLCYFDGFTVTEIGSYDVIGTNAKSTAPSHRTVNGEGVYHSVVANVTLDMTNDALKSFVETVVSEVNDYNIALGGGSSYTYGQNLLLNNALTMETSISTRTYGEYVAVADPTDDADWSQLLEDTQNIRNYLNRMNNGLLEIQYSLTGRVSLSQPNSDTYTDIVYTDKYDYLLTSNTPISDVHISSSNDKRLIFVFSQAPESFHFYRFYNGNWIDITSSVTSTSSERQFGYNESYTITGLNTINGLYSYSYTNLNDENTIISPLSHTNDYILIICCFVCCFVTLSMAWHTSAQFKRISNNKF